MGIDRRGKSWRARVTLPDRTQRSRSFRTKAEAVRWEAEQKTALNRGNWVDPSDRTTMAEYARQWAALRPAPGVDGSSCEKQDRDPHRRNQAREPANRSPTTVRGAGVGHRAIAALESGQPAQPRKHGAVDLPRRCARPVVWRE